MAQGPNVVAYATLDRAAPPAFSITPTYATLDAFSAANAGVKFSSAEVGDTYSYTVASDGTATGNQVTSVSVTDAGTVTAAGQTVPINLSGLAPGNLTYTVTLTNSADNVKSETATGTLASAFTVTPDQGNVKSVEGFTLGDAEVGATYNYTITDSLGATVTGTGTVTSATQDITGIDVSSLTAGAVTISVTLTDLANTTSSPVTAAATIDPAAPTAIELSTSVVSTTASVGGQVALLQTVSAIERGLHLLAGFRQRRHRQFHLPLRDQRQRAGDQCELHFHGRSELHGSLAKRRRDGPLHRPAVRGHCQRHGSHHARGEHQRFHDGHRRRHQRLGGHAGHHRPVRRRGGATVDYGLVPGSGDNSQFKIVDGQLEAVGTLTANTTYHVVVQSVSTYLISDVVQLTGATGPLSNLVSFDPTQLPSTNYEQLAVNAGLISLMALGPNGWTPAVNNNLEFPGTQAQPNYAGSYASFTAANPSATVSNSVGSSGVDQTANTAWAVVDQSGQYAVGVQVFTQQVLTITTGA